MHIDLYDVSQSLIETQIIDPKAEFKVIPLPKGIDH